ncbi:MAG: response regulator, partial [Bacteroidetes bacterium]|nr:response regulator [Bacteroidota bacterium]
NQQLFQWVPGQDTLRVRRSAARFVHAFAVRDTLYVAEAGTGLLRHTADDSLAPVPGTGGLGEDRITIVLTLSPRGLLIGTMNRGLFRYDGRTLQPIPSPANALLREHLLYRGIALPGGRFAFATLRGGVFILSDDGQIERIIDTQDGLQDNTVTNLFTDGEGGLWLTLNDGIARADWPAPFTSFGEANGLAGIVEAIARHDGRLYAATNRGVFVLSPTSQRAARFSALTAPPTDCRSLLSVGRDVLAGCGDGLYRIRGTTATRLFASSSIRALGAAPFDSTLVLAGDSDGLRRVERRGDRWVAAGLIAGLDQPVSRIAFAPDGAVWAGLSPEGVARVRNVTAAAPEVTVFRPGERDLPSGGIYLARDTEHPLFLTETGLYRYVADPDGTESFQPDARFGPAFAGAPDGSPGRSALVAQTDAQDNVWMFAWPDVGVARRQPGGSFRWQASLYHRARMPFVYAIYPDPDGTLWFGGTEGIVRYDPSQALSPPPPRRPIVHRMTPVGSDSVLFANAAAHTPVLRYSDNAVRFTYALPSYHRRAAARFQVQLDGFDAGWSAWTEETRKDYTNLPEGAYTFRVRGEDAFGQVSPERAVAFTIVPPWYRTPWAYLLWGLLGVALIGGVGYGAVRGRTRQLEARGRELEALVQARTEEVSRQNQQLEAQAERLAELDAVKSRFFANISHEFRTPLTLTLGPIEDILSGAHGPVQDAVGGQLRLVHRNASRLLRLINQLLDLARLETGHVPLEATRADLVEMLDRFVRAFTPLAERRQMTLAFEATEPHLLAYIDPDKLEKMIANLLSNAFKATDAGGTIRVRLRRTDAHAEIAVDDTGMGIAADALPTIFDRFNQRLEGAAAGAGTGIGLNLTKEFVELHGGTIDVTSTPGVGTTFTVRLPLGRGHLRDDQLVDAPPDMTPPSPPPPMAPDGYATDADENTTPPAPSENGPTVLIVDDNPDIRAYVRDQLMPQYHVVEAEDGIAGYERAKAVLPDCIISDVMMPRQDGYALTAQIKADPDLDHVPLILLTAKAEAEHKIEGLTAGADDYL